MARSICLFGYFVETAELLRDRGKVRGNPVGITLFRECPPADYTPLQDTPCAIVREAMDNGKRIYVDAAHHDCLVGVHHAGITPGTPAIVSGEYLSKPSNFFTYEAAARLKASTPVLPPGMFRAVGAAPLDQVPEGVEVNWIVVVCKPHNANFIGGCRLSQEGVPPGGLFGTSLCGELFARPWHDRNVAVVGGDFGGRMHNKIKHDQLFVVVPIEYARYLSSTLWKARINVGESREMTKPSHSEFWSKRKKKAAEKISGEKLLPDDSDGEPGGASFSSADQTNESIPSAQFVPTGNPEGIFDSLHFAFPWDDEAREMLKLVPEGLLETVVGNAEDYAREKNYKKVTVHSMNEQMKERFGMTLDEMIASM